jgi:hypothetical protein
MTSQYGEEERAQICAARRLGGGGIDIDLKHYRLMRYGQLALPVRSIGTTIQCALHHIAGPNADEVCYLHGASSLDTVSS